MVSILSERDSIVRVAIIAGTLQPKPMSIGINDLPCKPIRCIILSIIKTTLAMYPVSSINVIKKNKMRMLGKKTITLPTPEITPSTRRSFYKPPLLF